MQSALGQTRMQVGSEQLESAPWYAAMSDESKQYLREQGRRVLEAMRSFVAAGAPDEGLSSAIALGKDYAERLIADGITLPQATRGFYFFSDFVLEFDPDLVRDCGSPAIRPNGRRCCARSIPICTPCSSPSSNTMKRTDVGAEVFHIALSMSPNIGAKTLSKPATGISTATWLLYSRLRRASCSASAASARRRPLKSAGWIRANCRPDRELAAARRRHRDHGAAAVSGRFARAG